MVIVEYCYKGEPTKKIRMSDNELRDLLKTTVGCVDVDISTFSNHLNGLTLKLSDGRYVILSEENNPSWEGSSEGWIYVSVYDEERYRDLIQWLKDHDAKYGSS